MPWIGAARLRVSSPDVNPLFAILFASEQRKTDDDLRFLERLRDARDRETLERMLANHAGAPEWKRIAIARRLRSAASSTTPPAPASAPDAPPSSRATR